MPRNWNTEDAVEPVSDTMMEAFGNWQNYNIVSGCELTYSGTDMTVAVSAGQARINGTLVAVPASTEALSADASNPLWAWVCFGHDTIGVNYQTQVISGTPAADPTVPEYASNFSVSGGVELALVLVEPNQTIAANCTYKFDKRMFGPRVVVVSAGGSGSSAILNADTACPFVLTDVDDLVLPVVANTTYSFRALIHYMASASGDYFWQLRGPGKLTVLSQSFDLSATGIVQGVPSSGVVSGAANGFGTSTPGVLAVEGSLVTTAAGTLQFKHGSSVTGGVTMAKSRLELF